MRVLIVDDDPIVRTVCSHLIRRLGFAVDFAGSAAAAMERLRRQPYDCIVLDAHLPDMHGAEVTRAVRADLRIARIPIIACSSDDGAANLLLFREAGVNAFLSKPLTKEKLGEVLKRWFALPPAEENL